MVTDTKKLNQVFDKISAYFIEFRKTNPPKSKFTMQNHVFKQLQEQFPSMKFEQEVTIDKHDLIYVDVVEKQKKIVFEVDGPQHYLFNNTEKPLAEDVLSKKIIGLLGYKVCRISTEEFNLMNQEEKS